MPNDEAPNSGLVKSRKFSVTWHFFSQPKVEIKMSRIMPSQMCLEAALSSCNEKHEKGNRSWLIDVNKKKCKRYKGFAMLLWYPQNWIKSFCVCCCGCCWAPKGLLLIPPLVPAGPVALGCWL